MSIVSVGLCMKRDLKKLSLRIALAMLFGLHRPTTCTAGVTGMTTPSSEFGRHQTSLQWNATSASGTHSTTLKGTFSGFTISLEAASSDVPGTTSSQNIGNTTSIIVSSISTNTTSSSWLDIVDNTKKNTNLNTTLVLNTNTRTSVLSTAINVSDTSTAATVSNTLGLQFVSDTNLITPNTDTNTSMYALSRPTAFVISLSTSSLIEGTDTTLYSLETNITTKNNDSLSKLLPNQNATNFMEATKVTVMRNEMVSEIFANTTSSTNTTNANVQNVTTSMAETIVNDTASQAGTSFVTNTLTLVHNVQSSSQASSGSVHFELSTSSPVSTTKFSTTRATAVSNTEAIVDSFLNSRSATTFLQGIQTTSSNLASGKSLTTQTMNPTRTVGILDTGTPPLNSSSTWVIWNHTTSVSPRTETGRVLSSSPRGGVPTYGFSERISDMTTIYGMENVSVANISSSEVFGLDDEQHQNAVTTIILCVILIPIGLAIVIVIIVILVRKHQKNMRLRHSLRVRYTVQPREPDPSRDDNLDYCNNRPASEWSAAANDGFDEAFDNRFQFFVFDPVGVQPEILRDPRAPYTNNHVNSRPASDISSEFGHKVTIDFKQSVPNSEGNQPKCPKESPQLVTTDNKNPMFLQMSDRSAEFDFPQSGRLNSHPNSTVNGQQPHHISGKTHELSSEFDDIHRRNSYKTRPYTNVCFSTLPDEFGNEEHANSTSVDPVRISSKDSSSRSNFDSKFNTESFLKQPECIV